MFNKKQWQYLKKAHQRGMLSQAYLFAGPSGVGKFDLAIKFVKLINERGDKSGFALGQDPDVFIIDPIIEEKAGKRRKKDISIQQIKEISGKLGYYAYQSKFKVLIINGAQLMTDTTSNSLLKLIEEPPADLIIILVSNSEQRVLPTLRSRCQSIRFGLERAENIVKYLEKKYSDKEVSFLNDCAILSQGRIKIAESLASDKMLFEEIQNEREMFRGALKGGLLKGLEFSVKLATDKERLLQLMAQWIWYLRDFLIDHINENRDKKIAKKVFSMLQALVNLRFQIQRTNINQRVQLDNFFVQIS